MARASTAKVPRQAKAPADPLVVSTQILRRFLGDISAARVGQLKTEGMPQVAHGQWHLAEVHAWWRERLESRQESDELREARILEIRARTEKHEHDLARMRAEVITQEDAQQVVAALASSIADALRNIPARIDAPRAIRDEVRHECDAALRAIAASAEQCARDLRATRSSGDGSTAAADEDSG